MRRASFYLVVLAALPGCSFLDDFDSFHQPDGGAADGGHDAAPSDGGGSDAGDLGDGGDGGAACTSGVTADCDSNPATPCDRLDSRAHCGDCGTRCSLGEACTGGSCMPDPVVRLAAGHDSACAIHQSGDVQCWGDNHNGKLGTGDTANHDTPRDVVGLPEPVVEVSIGDDHTCARATSGNVYCWGSNLSGQLGDGTFDAVDGPHPTPTRVLTLAHALSIAAGYGFTCAIEDATVRSVYCWGSNSYDVLGMLAMDLVQDAMPREVSLPGSGPPFEITATRYDESVCVSRESNGVWCWGGDADGELGDGMVGSSTPTPTAIATATGATLTSVRAGYMHVCAMDPGGHPYCWGASGYGEMGRATLPSDPASPGLTTPPPAVVSEVAPGRYHTCWLSADSATAGQIFCAGDNEYGQLGIGGMTALDFNAPQAVPLPPATRFQQVVAGGLFTCALSDMASGQKVYCWGNNSSGETGSGDSTAMDPRHLSPTLVSGF